MTAQNPTYTSFGQPPALDLGEPAPAAGDLMDTADPTDTGGNAVIQPVTTTMPQTPQP